MQDENRKIQRGVGRGRCRLLHQGPEVERRLGHPTQQGLLHLRAQGGPRALPVPIVDKGRRGRAMVADDDAFANPAREVCDLCEALRAGLAHLP
jgi:hypothetical protein